MRLISGYVAAFREDIQLEVPAAKLGFKITSASDSLTPANAALMKLSVKLNSQNGTIVLIPKMSLLDLLNMSAADEGFYHHEDGLLIGSVDLSQYGSILPMNGYLSLSYEGFPADASTTIFAIDTPLRTKFAQKIEEVIVQGTKELNVSSKTQILIPVSSGGNGLDEMQIQYVDRVMTLNDEELDIIGMSTNDIVKTTDTDVTYGTDRLYVLSLVDAVSIRITSKSTTAYKIYLLSDIAV